MAQIRWTNRIGGNFGDGGNWSGGSVPGPTDRAVVDATGVYTVSLTSDVTLQSLVISDSGATFVLGGSFGAPQTALNLAGSILLRSGTFMLNESGILNGGTIDLLGGKFECGPEGVLNGVTFDGALVLAGNDSFTVGQSGLVLRGSGGVGPGAIDFVGSDNGIFFQDNLTLDNATLNFQSGSGGSLAGSRGALTLGENFVLESTCRFPEIAAQNIYNLGKIDIKNSVYAIIESVGGGGVECTIDNEGSITFESSRAVAQYQDFVNGGVLTVDSGSVVRLESFTSFENTGQFVVTGGGEYASDASFR